jgi:hypothetical protein
MKHVVFKVVPIASPTKEPGELDYRAYMELAVKQPLDGKSIGVDEMHKSIRLLSALRDAKEDGVDFEDTDFDYLCAKMKALKFSWVDPAFEQFVSDVVNSE